MSVDAHRNRDPITCAICSRPVNLAGPHRHVERNGETTFVCAACLSKQPATESPQAVPKPHIVAVGYGSEFSLHPLCDALTARGFSCTRIDMYESGWRERYRPPIDGGEVVLLSSQHPAISRSIVQRRFGFDADVLTLPDTIEFFRPARSFLLSHDLTHSFLDEEVTFMQGLTAVLTPDDRYWYFRRWVPVHVVGWTKLIAPTSLAEASGVVLMPTDVYFFARMPELFRDTFAGLLRPGIRFKLPLFAGTEPLRDILLAGGCEEIPPETDSTSVIARHATIVSNGASSIILEAALTGKDVLCVNCDIPQLDPPERAWSNHENVELVDPVDLAAALASDRRGKTWPSELQPLDIDKVVELIHGFSPP